MHLDHETLGFVGMRCPCGYFMLGYPDELDPYCAWGIIVQWGSAKSTAMLCSEIFKLRDQLHSGVGPSVLDGLGVKPLHQGMYGMCSCSLTKVT